MNDIYRVKQTIGGNIREMRKKAKLTQKELAARLNKSRFWLTAIETGANLPTIEGLYQIADTLSCSIHAILPLNSGAGYANIVIAGESVALDAQHKVMESLKELQNG